jgi:hypothetical protein
MEITSTPINDIDIKIPKNKRSARYYYAHRDEILARRKEKLLEVPEYAAKQAEKERKKKEKEEKEQLKALKIQKKIEAVSRRKNNE